jgi:anti-sigma factor RsiW
MTKLVEMHIQQHFLSLIEKRLSPAERARAEAHLAACPECRDELAELRDLASSMQAMLGALRALPNRGRSLWPAIWARVQRPTARPAYSWPVAASLSLVAACLSVLSLVGPTLPGAWTVTAGLANTAQAALETPHAPQPAVSAASTVRAPQAGFPLPAPVQTPAPGPAS